MRLPRLPYLVGAVVQRLPRYPPSAALSAALNLFARDVFSADEMPRLEGKTIRLHVSDAGLTLTVRIAKGGYGACMDATVPDAVVSAEARDFVQLALGKVDPDTLFFDRRLTISGDTDLGLIVKHALDRIEPPLPRRIMDLLRAHID